MTNAATPPTEPDDADPPLIGVVICAYAAEDFIAACLESVVATGWPRLRVMVVDNASPDATAAAVRDWATGAAPFVATGDWPLPRRDPVPKPVDFADHAVTEHAPAPARPAQVTLLRSPVNLGFAGGVNAGLKALAAQGGVDHAWVLNPDSVTTAEAPFAFARRAAQSARYGMISGRVTFYDRPHVIQADGGRYRPWMGYGGSINVGRTVDAPYPDPARMNYVPGMSMFVSRAFLERAGLMEEDYFLYYEEIDWAFRRGDLPILFEPEARVLHRAGKSIGTGIGGRAASPMSAYFTHRNLPRFVLRWTPWRAPATLAVCAAVVLRDYVLRHRGAWAQLGAALRGLAQMGPPAAVRARLAPEVWRRLGL